MQRGKAIGMGIPKDFSYLDLNGRDFIQAKMFGANLTDADLTDAKLDNVIWPAGWKLVRDE